MKRLLLILIMLILMPSLAWGLACTSTATVGTYNWSNPATWGGGCNGTSDIPGDGDTVTISAPTVDGVIEVVVDANTTVGATIGTNPGVNIAGTSATRYAKLTVPSGVTLVMKGVNFSTTTTVYPAMLINRYAKFVPQGGSTIQVSCTSDYQTGIVNKGTIEAIGSAGNYVTFTVPDAKKPLWNTAVTATDVTSVGTNYYWYDYQKKLRQFAFSSNYWIANAAGTGIGLFGDSSVVISNINASYPNILTTEVATLAEVDATGEYWVDYDLGQVIFYYDSQGQMINGVPCKVAYKYMNPAQTMYGWGIKSVGATTYNEALFDYCKFEYMGTYSGVAAAVHGLVLDGHKSTANTPNRVFYLKNSVFNYMGKLIQIINTDGTAADPILITGNRFNQAYSGLYFYRAPATYFKFANNTHNHSTTFATIVVITNITDFIGWEISGNTIRGNNFLQGTSGANFAGLSIKNNTVNGLGMHGDARLISQVSGTTNNPVVIENNTFNNTFRLFHFESNSVFKNNYIVNTYHHTHPTSPVADVLIQNTELYNNFYYGFMLSPTIEIGYNYKQHVDKLFFYNNTIVSNGTISYGDISDTNTATAITRSRIFNNLIYATNSGAYAFQRRDASSVSLNRIQQDVFDYNLAYNQATGRYESDLNGEATYTKGGSNYNLLDGASRNLTGLSLQNSNYSFTDKTIRYTYTSATDVTMEWCDAGPVNCGTPVQMVLASDTVSSATRIAVNSISGLSAGTLVTATAAKYNTTWTNAAYPGLHWLRMTSGAESTTYPWHVITTVTDAVTLNVVPGWGNAVGGTAPSNGDTYAIYKTEARLYDSGGSNYLDVGMYWRDMPMISADDTGLGKADHSVNSNPLLISTTAGTTEGAKVGASSPAIGAGWTGPGVDYFGTARPQGSGYDIGFFEYPAANAKNIWDRIFKSRIFH